MASVFSITQGMKSAVILDLDNVSDAVIFELWKLLTIGVLLLDGVTLVEKFGGAEERA